jgi:hypothetical protein
LPQLFGLLRPEIGERGARCRPVRGSRAKLGGALVHIGVRSICAGIAALAIGAALDSVGRHLAEAASATLWAESALFSVFETIRPKSLDHRASLVRVASLEAGFAFESVIEESEPPASTSRHASFGERFLFDQNLASFDERFLGADISVAEPEEGARNVLNLPSPDSREHAIAQCDRPIRAEACNSRFITARERRKKTGCDCGGIEGFDFTGSIGRSR